MRNRFAGHCIRCGQWIAAGMGLWSGQLYHAGLCPPVVDRAKANRAETLRLAESMVAAGIRVRGIEELRVKVKEDKGGTSVDG